MKASTDSKNQLFAPAIAAGILMACSTAQAAIVFSDTFDSGTGAWYKAYDGTGGNAITLSNDSGRLSFDLESAGVGYGVIGRSFSTQTIDAGQSITLSFDYRQTSATGILRLGLHDRS